MWGCEIKASVFGQMKIKLSNIQLDLLKLFTFLFKYYAYKEYIIPLTI